VAKKNIKKKKVQVVSKKVVKKITKNKPVKKVVKKIENKKILQKKQPLKPVLDYSKAVTPLGDRLVVRLTKAETKTAGGLYIPDMVQSAAGHLKAEVLAVGQGHTTKKGFLRSMDVQKGDFILFPEHAGIKVIFNSEELYIVNETDVLGITQK